MIWITNAVAAQAEADLKREADRRPGKTLVLGEPGATDRFSVDELKYRGLVGIYEAE